MGKHNAKKSKNRQMVVQTKYLIQYIFDNLDKFYDPNKSQAEIDAEYDKLTYNLNGMGSAKDKDKPSVKTKDKWIESLNHFLKNARPLATCNPLCLSDRDKQLLKIIEAQDAFKAAKKMNNTATKKKNQATVDQNSCRRQNVQDLSKSDDCRISTVHEDTESDEDESNVSDLYYYDDVMFYNDDSDDEPENKIKQETHTQIYFDLTQDDNNSSQEEKTSDTNEGNKNSVQETPSTVLNLDIDGLEIVFEDEIKKDEQHAFIKEAYKEAVSDLESVYLCFLNKLAAEEAAFKDAFDTLLTQLFEDLYQQLSATIKEIFYATALSICE